MKELLAIPNSHVTRPPKVHTWILEAFTGVRQRLGDDVCTSLKRQRKPPPWMREIMRRSRAVDPGIEWCLSWPTNKSLSSCALFEVVTATKLLVSRNEMSVNTTGAIKWRPS